jgi:predicted metal-dependent hydrolase
MQGTTPHQIMLGGRQVDYSIVRSKGARKLRLRIGPHGVVVIQPAARNSQDVSDFLDLHEAWILNQLERVTRLRCVRRSVQLGREILFRGVPTPVRVERTETRARGNVVEIIDGEIVVARGAQTATPPERSLERWFRKHARAAVSEHLTQVLNRLGKAPGRVFIRGQRTKWGGCSSSHNLSFNWRLILAPDAILRYLVTHEAAHLVVPDHSARFWLTVQSLCPDMERSKQWLSACGPRLFVNLRELCVSTSPREQPAEHRA